MVGVLQVWRPLLQKLCRSSRCLLLGVRGKINGEGVASGRLQVEIDDDVVRHATRSTMHDDDANKPPHVQRNNVFF